MQLQPRLPLQIAEHAEEIPFLGRSPKPFSNVAKPDFVVSERYLFI
jgi:hypothetical protein